MATTEKAARGEPLLRMRGITKFFGGLCAVAETDLELWGGEILAIVGDNGAGKSTLIKILTGVHRADDGEIALDGRPTRIESRRHAKDLGIEAVYQNLGAERGLIPAHGGVRLVIEAFRVSRPPYQPGIRVSQGSVSRG